MAEKIRYSCNSTSFASDGYGSPALQSLNIAVEQLHAEAGKGQFELALGYTLCSNAADNLIFTREVVRSVARKHGLLATFMPK
ncbi:Type-1 glutamine synthetase 1 [Camellia lanceoleosa]|uniref:Type-1 glutamine synthetase 1 n=1 Tax=Camellia lanceoleosa TaxID=1840588 RepID=A0ACC0IZR1_9ERIC|nr:Type-1 glutamine synthetase 1 [Camellia lanceoleosa]